MNKQNRNDNVNHQTHGHTEGQQNNIAPQQVDGQRNTRNNDQPMSNMMQESEEQKAGRAHGQKDERNVQDEERLP